jgi:hypothetical protein
MAARKTWIVVLCSILLPLNASAAVSNGGFETGSLSGWSQIGFTPVQTASIGVSPTEGTYQGYINNTGNFAAPAAAVASFLGVSGPTLLALGAGIPTTGSAISQDLTVSAGDVLTFDWNFLTDEHNEGVAYNDFAIFTIASAANLLASRDSTFFTLNLSSPPAGFDGQTNYAPQSYTFTSGGTFKLGFAVFNVGDAGHDSVLLVDNIAIPEPATASLLLLAAVSGIVRHRR